MTDTLRAMRPLSFESCETLTQEEFARWVERWAKDDHHYELLNGRVVMEPPAGWPHGEAESELNLELAGFVRRQRLGRVLGSSQGFELPSGDTVQPDLTYISNERWAAAPEPRPGRFLQVVPDLVIEILSPSNAWRDRGEKKAIYESNGVSEYWLVDPPARQITRFVLRDGRFDGGTVFDGESVLRSEVLAGLEIRVGDFRL